MIDSTLIEPPAPGSPGRRPPLPAAFVGVTAAGIVGVGYLFNAVLT